MKNIQNYSALFFIFCVTVLTGVSILGVWDIFTSDVVLKSFQTLGLLAGVAAIVMLAGKFMDGHNAPVASVDPALGQVQPAAVPKDPIFASLRHLTLGVLVVAVAVLALIGVLAIWDVLSGSVMHKAVSSIAIVAFSSLIIVVTCLEREESPLLHQKVSGKVIILVLFLAWILFAYLF